MYLFFFFFFSSRRRHTRSTRDWSSDVCSSDLMSASSCWCSRSTAAAGAGQKQIASHTIAKPRHEGTKTRRQFILVMSISRLLGGNHEMRAPVLAPGAFVMAGVERKFAAVTDRMQAIGVEAERDQIR